MGTFPILSYVVSALGILLCGIAMLFIFRGIRVSNAGKPQVLKWKGLEVRTDAVTALLIVSLFPAVLPLFLEYKLQVQGMPAVRDENKELHEENMALRKRYMDLKAQADQLQFQAKSTATVAPANIYVNGSVSDTTGRPLVGAVVRIIRTYPPPEQPIKESTVDGGGSFAEQLQVTGSHDMFKLVAEKKGYSSQVLVLGREYATVPAVLRKEKK